MDVLVLKGLKWNYEKLRSFVKMAKVRKPKFEGQKSNFEKTYKQPWSTNPSHHRIQPRETHEGWLGMPLGQVMANNRHEGGQNLKKTDQILGLFCRDMQMAFLVG